MCGRRRKLRLEPDNRSSRFVIVREIPNATPFRVSTFTRTTPPFHKMPNATHTRLFAWDVRGRTLDVKASAQNGLHMRWRWRFGVQDSPAANVRELSHIVHPGTLHKNDAFFWRRRRGSTSSGFTDPVGCARTPLKVTVLAPMVSPVDRSTNQVRTVSCGKVQPVRTIPGKQRAPRKLPRRSGDQLETRCDRNAGVLFTVGRWKVPRSLDDIWPAILHDVPAPNTFAMRSPKISRWRLRSARRKGTWSFYISPVNLVVALLLQET